MRIFGWSDGHGGVFHYRIKEPLRGLRLLGCQTQTGSALQLKLADAYDTILVRALHNPHESRGWLALAQQGRHLLVYDLDDDVWAWHPTSESARYWNDQRRLQVEINIQVADVVSTPSPRLGALLAQLNPNVAILPNTVPKWLTSISQPRRDRFVVGWEGAHQHVHDLDLIYKPVFRFMVNHPDVEFHLWGPERDTWLPSIMQWLPPGLAGRVRCYGWQPDVPSYYRSLSMDVCLAPLEPTPFNETKSAIRIQEHSALGIPVIASPGPAYEGFLMDSVNGYFASSQASWEKTLERIYRNPTLGEQLGQNGRRLAKQKWTTEGQAAARRLIYQEAHDERARTRATANARVGAKPARPHATRTPGTTGITTTHTPILEPGSSGRPQHG
jgi:glycosyltransferase involved in cell wall biosynthesis